MKSKFFKVILVTLIAGGCSFAAFFVKDHLNRINLQNKNYLATSTRKRTTPFLAMKTMTLHSPLSREEFLKQGSEALAFSNDQTAQTAYVLTNVTNYKDHPSHSSDNGKLISVSFTNNGEQKMLYSKRLYPVEQHPYTPQYFEFNQKVDIDLKHSFLMYQLTIKDETSSPSDFINYLASFATTIEKDVSTKGLTSEITIQTVYGNYLYYSNLPNYLIEVQRLS